MALADAIDLLTCPYCRGPLVLAPGGRAVRCAEEHSFDVARQGYLNLHTGRAPKNADTTAMVAARDRFLTAGPYAPIVDRLVKLATAHAAREAIRLLEVGAGTGYYLSGLLDGLEAAGMTAPRGVALDVSVAAARRAARAHPRVASVVADVWQPLPLGDGSVDLLLDVFAPRHADEFRRVLAASGLLLVVTPQAEHLGELRRALGLLDIQPAKHEELRSTLAGALSEQTSESLQFAVTLEDDSVRDLVAMGPNAFHLSEAQIEDRVASVPTPVRVTAAVTLSVWSPRG